MKHDVQVPEIGESVSSGILASWLKQTGEAVSEGEEIFELETDKATLAVPSPASGVLEVMVAEDTEVAVGQVVAAIATEAGDAAGAEAGSGDAADAAGTDVAGTAAAEKDAAAAGSDAPALSPAVRRVVEEHGLDPAQIRGSGPGGRITKEDALKAAEHAGGAGDAAGAPGGPGAPASASESAPADRAAAAGPSASQEPGRQEPTGAAASSRYSNERQAGGGERETRKKLSNLRKRVAENLVSSQQNSAHLTTFNEVDMSAVIELRTRYRDEFEARHGVKLGFMSFFVKAAQRALESYPEINARIDGDEVVYHNYYNIGVALSSERGLVTPVLREVERKSFAEIEAEILSFIKRAQEKKLMPDELAGGTFTISNGGVFGSMLSTPIPSPPQSGVLGMHTIQKRPVAVNDEVVIRPMMYLALTYDHRIVDGREAIGFLMTIKRAVEDPSRLALGL